LGAIALPCRKGCALRSRFLGAAGAGTDGRARRLRSSAPPPSPERRRGSSPLLKSAAAPLWLPPACGAPRTRCLATLGASRRAPIYLARSEASRTPAGKDTLHRANTGELRISLRQPARFKLLGDAQSLQLLGSLLHSSRDGPPRSSRQRPEARRPPSGYTQEALGRILCSCAGVMPLQHGAAAPDSSDQVMLISNGQVATACVDAHFAASSFT